MIKTENGIFHLNTNRTSYLFRVTNYGDLEHLYYGAKIAFQSDYKAFFQQRSMLLVSTLYPEGDISYGIDDMCFEYAPFGRGDMRDSAYLVTLDGRLCSFKYQSFTVLDTPLVHNPNPTAYGAAACLQITLKDESDDVLLHLYYTVFPECDVITRSAEIEHCAEGSIVTIEKLMSAQLDFDRDDWKLLTFDGAWSRERHKTEHLLCQGKFVNDSISGASSARHNPFVLLAAQNADSVHGECFGMNLIYSGNHYESAEVCPYGKTRLLSGLHPQTFRHSLSVREQFSTPECVMTFSPDGYNGVSQNMHAFVKDHIVRGYWKNREKPVLLNSWEAMYFDLTEEKIDCLADKAAAIGVELLVVDDGWFGKRNDDTSSLGDWFVNKTKFPNGMKHISDAIHQKGLLFGLWFEPEMISKNSLLFEQHPDWALGQNVGVSIVGRNQMLLDLSRDEVQDYLISALSEVIREVQIDYIKWDFNRLFSDLSSAVTPLFAVSHTYVLGLYRILEVLTRRFPKVLFELCASGGTRFDLGMLCYMPVGWVSDNTDVYSRVQIQEGTSYAYPPSVMCNHISACPNHQTKRVTKLLDRYNTASFGVLGLQYDLTTLTQDELEALKEYIATYKEMRNILTDGAFYRLTDGFACAYNSWLLVSKDKKTAYFYFFQKLFAPVTPLPKLKLIGLDSTYQYRIAQLGFSASGEILMQSGLLMPQNYQGNEVSPEGNLLTDFSSVLYKLEKELSL